MKRYNIGILAHVDAGKTTITEQLLYLTGEIRKGGSVDSGTTTSDYLEVERRRGISVKSACVELKTEEELIQIIDTPGHVDFSGEVARTLPAMDGVVLVISAAEGVQAQTLTIFRALQEMGIPVLLVANKIDRAGYDPGGLLKELKTTLSPMIVPLQEVKNPAAENCEIIESASAAAAIFETLADIDAELEEAFLLEEQPEDAVLFQKLEKYTKECKAFPLLFASAKNGKGITGILDGIRTYLPEESTCVTENLHGVIFAVSHDPLMGRVAYARLFGGVLKSRDQIPFTNQEPEQFEKITQIRRIQGDRYTDIGEMHQGEICALYGLSNCRIGDFIGEPGSSMPEFLRRRMAGILSLHTEPMLLTEVKPVKDTDEPALVEALTILSDEDPLLAYERNELTGQMFLHIMGEIQVEILKEMLETEYHLQTDFSKPKVIYKETPGTRGLGREVYTMPKPCWAIVDLQVEPLPRGSGIEFESVIKEKTLPYRYQNHVKESIYQTCRQGLYGWEVTDCKFTLVGGMSHHVHTHPLDFFVATPVAVLRALQDSADTLLEPYMRMYIRGEEALVGKVSAQILKMKGSFDAPVLQNGQFLLEAVAPLSTCMDYPVEYRSLTSGRGSISMQLESYRPCFPEEIPIFPRRTVNPLDHAKWILSCRSAL